MHSEMTSAQHTSVKGVALEPSATPQTDLVSLPRVSPQDPTRVGDITLPSVFLIVDFPNGGETFNVGDMVTVRWSTNVMDGTPITSHQVKLFADGNLVQDVRDLPGTAQSYQLTLPTMVTTRAVVSVAALTGIRVVASDRSDNVFSIGGGPSGSVITAIDPPAIRAGATTRVTVNGQNLPANARDYALVNGAGQPVMGITLQLLSGNMTAAVFDIMIASFVAPGQYRFIAGTASAPFDILVNAAPDITSLEPSQIPAGATTPVTVHGSNLPVSPLAYLVVNSAGQQINGYGVELDGGNSTSSMVRLRITIASSVTPGQYGLRVVAAAGSDTATLEITGTVMPPDITAVSPSQILAGQTTQVIVDGMNLPLAANGYSILKSDGQLIQGLSVQLTSPGARSAILQIGVAASTPPGSYQLRAQNAAGFDTSPLQILPNAAPDITALQPSQIATGSTTRVSVSGANLPLTTSGYSVVDNAGRGVVGVGLTLLPGGQPNRVDLDLTIPTFIVAGPYRLRAQNLAGSDTAPLDILAGISRVELSASPSAQSIGPGQSASYTISLIRTNVMGPVVLAVSGLPPGATAGFSPNPVPGMSALLTITTAVNIAPGTRMLTISGSAAGVTVIATTVNLTIGGGVAITGFTPTSGPEGLAVEISGANFGSVLGVSFNGLSADEFRVNSPTSITAEVPDGASSGLIGVLMSDRIVMSPNSFTVAAASNKPKIDSFTPPSGKRGDTVTIRGVNFVPDNTFVRFNGSPKKVEVPATSVGRDDQDDTKQKLAVVVPMGAITGPLKVRVVVNGTSITSKASAMSFVVGPPSINRQLTTSSGAEMAPVTISGMNFVPGKDGNGQDYTVVKFSNGTGGEVLATIRSITTTVIDTAVPTGAKTGLVSVNTPQGSDMFPFNVMGGVKPEILKFAPLDGPEGAQVELLGKNFTGAMAVTFGGVTAPFIVNSDASITAYVPIRLNVGEADRRVSISVSAAGQSGSMGDFTVLAPKTAGTSFFGISGLVPGRGRAGDKVLIVGAELDRLERVEFAGVSASAMSRSRNSVEATVPAVAMNGIVSVRGTDRNGMLRTVTRPAIVGVDFITDTSQGQPAIDGFTPRFGPRGTQVSIRGVNFTFMGSPNVRRIQFGSGNAAFTVISATEIQATVPNTGLTGRDPILVFPAFAGTTVTSGTDFITLPAGTPPPKGKESKEGKDTKEKEKEAKEKESEGKDFRKENKDTRDGKDFIELPFLSSGVVPPMERLARLEGAVGQLMHFIPQDLRPSLDASALKGETDLGYTDPSTSGPPLQTQASDAKQAKDTKDMEKPREGEV